MADKITIELDAKYEQHLDLLKQIIPNAEGGEITENGPMVEALIDSFMAFIHEQAAAHAGHEGGCCGGGSCGSHDDKGHDHWHGGCGCSH